MTHHLKRRALGGGLGASALMLTPHTLRAVSLGLLFSAPPCQAFQKELGQKAGCIKTLRRSVRDLTRGSSAEDSQWLQNQIEELDHRWELTCQLSVSKQGRLEAALRQVRGSVGQGEGHSCRGTSQGLGGMG